MFFTCAGEFEKHFVLRGGENLNRGQWPQVVDASLKGPKAQERALGFEAGFPEGVGAQVRKQGNSVVLDLDSRTHQPSGMKRPEVCGHSNPSQPRCVPSSRVWNLRC